MMDYTNYQRYQYEVYWIWDRRNPVYNKYSTNYIG